MKIVLRPTPDFLDLEGWRAYLEEVRADAEDVVGRDLAIKDAEAMVKLLEEHEAAQRGTEGR
ncbi:hypothetical protein [Rhodovulum sp. P5]|uniref:hypothetical protein n=1 Tax=Rhodovulum sp. P5 TaxID=1564506 RepID=UPI0009DAAE94|nr:hypothetical protein [Rhodovulum sp. P5]